MLPQLHRDDTIKMDSNPSYESYTGQSSNVAVQPNPSYDVSKPNRKIAEDQYEFNDVAVEPNPSYGVAMTMGTNPKTATDSDVTVTLNPAYGCVKAKK